MLRTHGTRDPRSVHDFGVTVSHPMARRVEGPELDS